MRTIEGLLEVLDRGAPRPLRRRRAAARQRLRPVPGRRTGALTLERPAVYGRRASSPLGPPGARPESRAPSPGPARRRAMMSVQGGISRRSVLKMMAAGATGVAASLEVSRASAAARLVVGAAYAGPKDDYGWNQGHAQGVAALKQIDGVKVVEEENVP